MITTDDLFKDHTARYKQCAGGMCFGNITLSMEEPEDDRSNFQNGGKIGYACKKLCEDSNKNDEKENIESSSWEIKFAELNSTNIFQEVAIYVLITILALLLVSIIALVYSCSTK